jgi:hypothetical protein
MTTQEVPPRRALFRMMTGHHVSQAIYAVAKLGIADLLGDGPRRPNELATATGTDGVALRRVLRLLASVGVFTEEAGGEFALTPIGTCLRGGVPGSMRAAVLLYGGIVQRAWGHLMHSLITSEPAFFSRFRHGFVRLYRAAPGRGSELRCGHG